MPYVWIESTDKRSETIADGIISVVISSKRIAGRSIARRLGRKYNSYFRLCLQRLRESGIITSDSSGYSIAADFCKPDEKPAFQTKWVTQWQFPNLDR